MKKILLMLLLCLAVVSCGKKDEVTDEVTEASTTQAQDYGVPNPFEIVDTLDEAAKIAGFSLEAPTEYADYNSLVIQAIADDMIEVIYFDAEKTHEGLRIRKAVGTDDISGDYNEYKEENVVKVGEGQYQQHYSKEQKEENHNTNFLFFHCFPFFLSSFL